VYDIGILQVFKNGLLLTNTTDYTANDSTTVVLAQAADAGDEFMFYAWKQVNVDTNGNKADPFTIDNYTANAGDTAFNINNIDTVKNSIYKNGLRLIKSEDYTISGNTVTLNQAADAGDEFTNFNWIVDSRGRSPFEEEYILTTTVENIFDINAYKAYNLDIWVNGLKYRRGVDYTANDGTSVTFDQDVAAGSEILCIAWDRYTTGSNCTQDGNTVVDGIVYTLQTSQPPAGTTVFNLAYQVDQLQVFNNGVLYENNTDYTATDGSTITLTNATVSGDTITLIAFEKVYPNGVATTPYTLDIIVTSGGETSLNITGSSIALSVYKNGVRMYEGIDYDINGASIDLDQAASNNDRFQVYNWDYDTNNRSPFTEEQQVITANTSTVTVNEFNEGHLDVWRNGIRLIRNTDFTTPDNTTVNFATTVTTNEQLMFISWDNKPTTSQNQSATYQNESAVLIENNVQSYIDYDLNIHIYNKNQFMHEWNKLQMKKITSSGSVIFNFNEGIYEFDNVLILDHENGERITIQSYTTNKDVSFDFRNCNVQEYNMYGSDKHVSAIIVNDNIKFKNIIFKQNFITNINDSIKSFMITNRCTAVLDNCGFEDINNVDYSIVSMNNGSVYMDNIEDDIKLLSNNQSNIIIDKGDFTNQSIELKSEFYSYIKLTNTNLPSNNANQTISPEFNETGNNFSTNIV
jgi:hypothetical protein